MAVQKNDRLAGQVKDGCKVRAWFSEERLQQLGYFSLFIARELRIEDVKAFQAYKAIRNCTMRVLKQKHQPFVSALTLCTLVTHL